MSSPQSNNLPEAMNQPYLEQQVYRLSSNFELHKYFNLLTGYDMYLPALIICYVLFAIKLGPWFMKDRQAFDLRIAMRIYNFVNALINLGILMYGMYLTNFGVSFFTCEAINETYSAHICDLLLCSRIIDFLDTVFFVLRKKFNQISPLHVTHHALVPLAIYLSSVDGIFVYSGFLGFINSIVHVCMYGYYFMATFPNFGQIIWWKSYITMIQIVQFVISIIYYGASFFILPMKCGPVSLMPTLVNLFLSVTFLIMFISFYTKTYMASSKYVNDNGFDSKTNNAKSKGKSRIQSKIHEKSKKANCNNNDNNNNNTTGNQRVVDKLKAN